MTQRVFMWVQSRLGLGHLARAQSVCGALARDGFEVTLAHGGAPVSALPAPNGVTMVQLPVANAPNLESSEITSENGQPVDEAWRARRIEALKNAIVRAQPDAFMTETFPFGRWLFAFELVPVLDWLKQRSTPPLIVASVRDILTRPAKPKKVEAMIGLAHERYDLILGHADEDVIDLPASFPEMRNLSGMTRYTGYVVDVAHGPEHPRAGVVVAAGGGAVGGRLFETALQAKRIWTGIAGPWTLVVGPRFGAGALAALNASAPADVSILGQVVGLSALYSKAQLVVAQAGYNTVCEVLAQGARLTVVPYATAKETEQTIRAKRLQDLGMVSMVEEDALTPLSLVAAMERALEGNRPSHAIRFDGGDRCARILRQALAGRTR